MRSFFVFLLIFVFSFPVGAYNYAPKDEPRFSKVEIAANLFLDVDVETGDSKRVKYQYLEIFAWFMAADIPTLKQAGHLREELLLSSDAYKKEWIKKVYYPMFVKKWLIARYKKFIKRYPNSSLVPEAKLRIAEAYFKDGREYYKAKQILNDIIKNHPDDDHNTIFGVFDKKRPQCTKGNFCFKLSEATDKTAAWALYYRGVWFKRQKDLDRALREYPLSKKVIHEIYLIFSAKKDKKQEKK